MDYNLALGAKWMGFHSIGRISIRISCEMPASLADYALYTHVAVPKLLNLKCDLVV